MKWRRMIGLFLGTGVKWFGSTSRSRLQFNVSRPTATRASSCRATRESLVPVSSTGTSAARRATRASSCRAANVKLKTAT
jgi:hypothetical protein